MTLEAVGLVYVLPAFTFILRFYPSVYKYCSSVVQVPITYFNDCTRSPCVELFVLKTLSTSLSVGTGVLLNRQKAIGPCAE